MGMHFRENNIHVISNEEMIYHADVSSANDYYGFGMTMPGRSFQSDEYRYGIQGQEKDDEIKGQGNSINYTYRMLDARIGRFFAPDPLIVGGQQYPWYSPYQFAGNMPIWAMDLEVFQELIYTEALNELLKSIIKVVDKSEVLKEVYDRVSDVNRCNIKLHVGAIDRKALKK